MLLLRRVSGEFMSKPVIILMDYKHSDNILPAPCLPLCQLNKISKALRGFSQSKGHIVALKDQIAFTLMENLVFYRACAQASVWNDWIDW